MKAKETKLNDLMKFVDQKFSIPIFQRKYSWTEKQCMTLWNDILELSEMDSNCGHFIGSIVCYQLHDEDLPGVIKEKIIIDGQQRLTTMSLIMIALAKQYRNLGENGIKSYDYIMRNFIINSDYSGEDKYKLVPTYDDKETYFAIIEDREKELQRPSIQMMNNYNLFCDLLDNDEELLGKIFKGINRLDLVYVVLTKNQDNPQLIFESMNSTGLGLTQGDLLRNYLLLDVDSSEQQDLYEKYWKPIEQDFGRDDYVEKFDYFIRDYLTMLEKKTIKLDSGYEEFKDYYKDTNLSKEDILKELRRYSRFYSRIYRCIDEDKELNALWRELKIQRVDVANPFLMQIYNDYEIANETNEFVLTKEDFIEIIKAINAYVFRRYVVGIPTNSLNKTFAVLYNSINKEDYKNSVLATLVLLDSYKKFPNDSEFEEAFSQKDIYNIRLKNYILEKLENDNHLNGITIDGADISIEHIMPENENLPQCWKDVLGENWKEDHKNNLHRVGNLTITKGVYNSKMSDKSFVEKLNIPGGIKDSHYRLSDDVVDKEKWDIHEIDERSKRLSKQASLIWKYPTLTEEQIKPYKKTNKYEKVLYTNIDHLPQMKPAVFEAYKKYEDYILSLDEKITKTITKHYIAYKYDYSNFAEIVVYKGLLWIMLDIPPELLIDDQSLAENISDMGAWGTGNNRLFVYDIKDFEYIKGLIMQSYNYEKDSDI